MFLIQFFWVFARFIFGKTHFGFREGDKKMGQAIGKVWGQQKSKEEMLYELVINENPETMNQNIKAIKSLRREGAGLEWTDQDGYTPLIIACMNSKLYPIAETLIDLGANLNAYRPGPHAGTPLHHAVKQCLDATVELLLRCGANSSLRNDDCRTPLDVARIRGYSKVVRTIEDHISSFSGCLREIHGAGFLKALTSKLPSRKIWGVVLPCASNTPAEPFKLELVIYASSQDVQPRTIIDLQKAKIKEPKFHLSDPTLTIFDQSTKTRYKLASGKEGDKQQIQLLYSACSIPQNLPTMEDGPPLLPNALQMEVTNMNGWGNPTGSASHNGWDPSSRLAHSEASSSGWLDEAAKKQYNGWGVPDSGASGNTTQHTQIPNRSPSIVQTNNSMPASFSSDPSAPPILQEVLDEGLIHYPSIDLSPVDLSVSWKVSDGHNGGGSSSSSSCVMCWEAPADCACVPCGHVAGCMGCLNEIKAKKGVCPICRAQIHQVIKIYAV